MVRLAGRARGARGAASAAERAPIAMRRALAPGRSARALLLVGGLVLYLLLVFAVERPADPEAAHELRNGARGLRPARAREGPAAAALDRARAGRLARAPQPASARNRLRLATLLGACAGVAGLLIAATLLRADIPGSPRVVFTGPLNFAPTWLEMSAATTAAMWVPRALWKSSPGRMPSISPEESSP